MSRESTVRKYEQQVIAFHKKNNRAPKYRECGQYCNVVLTKRYGSWDEAVRTLLGVRSLKTKWTKGLINDEIVKMFAAKERYPVAEDFEPGLQNEIFKHYKKIHLACEFLLGGSMRVNVLRVLDELTPPSCETATTQEIVSVLQLEKHSVTIHAVRWFLEMSKLENFVVSGKYDRLTWWKLTNAGREFIKRFSTSPVPIKNIGTPPSLTRGRARKGDK